MRLLIVALVTAFALPAAAATKPPIAGVADALFLGSAKAPVVIEEYASLSCSHCAEFNAEVFPAFKAKYIDTGKVRYVLREFITPPTEVAVAAWMTARCAGKDQYFTFVDSFFRRQPEMFKTGDAKAALVAAGRDGGLDEPKVVACLNDQSQADAVQRRVDAAVARGVESTPTFFINGAPLPPVEPNLAAFDTAIAKALAAKPVRTKHRR